MRRSVFRKLHGIIAGPLIGVLLAMFAIPLSAQPGDPHAYEIGKEVTLSGTISAVVTKTVPGMLMGGHLLLTTASGQVDASLGRWALQGKRPLSVFAGQQVDVTGIMEKIKGKEVFITRTVKSGGNVYTLRNQHGIEISPQTRERAAQRGESL